MQGNATLREVIQILFSNNVVIGTDINDAWRNVLWCIARNGYSYVIEKGSYENEVRKQVDKLMVVIEEPGKRPLAPFMPGGSGIPAPATEESIHQYFKEYIMGIEDDRSDKEDYKYSDFIMTQIDDVIKCLKVSNGNTNQACITIGNEFSTKLKDPPCLKVIDFKVVNKKLNCSVYFRSWDIFAAFPVNIGGLQLLKEYVLLHLDNIEDGNIFAYSAGAHIYEMYFDIVNMLNVDKIKI